MTEADSEGRIGLDLSSSLSGEAAGVAAAMEELSRAAIVTTREVSDAERDETERAERAGGPGGEFKTGPTIALPAYADS
ncbi:hypothetical protein THAOC_11830, partial [Thalassiosira oceanica]